MDLVIDFHQAEAHLDHMRQQPGFSPELVDALNQLAEVRASYANADLETQHLLQESYQLAARLAYVEGQVTSLIAQSQQFILQGEPEQGMPAVSQAIELAEQSGNKELDAAARRATARLQEEIGDDGLALENLLKALVLACELQDEALEFGCRIDVGQHYLRVARYDEAAEHFRKGVQLGRPGDDRLALAHCQLAHTYLQQGNLSKALPIAQRALVDDAPSPAQRAALLHTLAEIELGLGPSHFEQAAEHLRQAQDLAAFHADGALRTQIRMSQARLLAQHGQLTQSIQILQTLAAEPAIQNRKPALAEVIGQICSIYKQAGQFDEALIYHEQAYQLRAAAGREKAERQIRALQIMHETREARRTAEILRLKTVVLEQMVQDRTQSLERTQMEMLERLAMAVETRDAITGDHVTRVGDLSARIAAKLGMPEPIVERIRLAARLHDIGKIGIPDYILLKRGRLSAVEYQIMKSHTIKGALMLANSPTPLFRMAEEIALSHHERWDGRGYPDRLAGDDIPITGRIVAVADAFDAMISVRPYKPAMPVAEAVAEIMRCSGGQFDPTVVQAFLAITGPELQTDIKVTPAEAPAPATSHYWSVPLTTVDRPIYTASVSVSVM